MPELPEPADRLDLDRANGGHQRGRAEPGTAVDETAPVEPAARPDPPRPRRASRLSMFYDWRYGVALGAFLIMLVVIFLAGQGLRDGAGETSPALPTLVSALGSGDGKPDLPGRVESTKTVTDTRVLPPIDEAHVVQPPHRAGDAPGTGPSSAATPAASPAATPGSGAGPTLATALPALPPTAPTYLLAAPPQPTTFVQNVVARLGIVAEITIAQVGQGDQPVVHAVAPNGVPVVRWNPRQAYFSYERGPSQLTPPPARAESDPRPTARAWLEEIGFDLTTIRYLADLVENQEPGAGPRLVRFTPVDLPAGEGGASLGMLVGVAADGGIVFANGYWFSLLESAEAPLRDSEDALQALQAGEGYAFGSSVPPERAMTITAVRLTYLLTRADDQSFLLQPVVAFSGPVRTPSGEALTHLYVTAVQK